MIQNLFKTDYCAPVQVSKSKILSLLTELLSTFSLDTKEATSEFVKAASALLDDPDPDGS
jgi:hypothetical protein